MIYWNCITIIRNKIGNWSYCTSIVLYTDRTVYRLYSTVRQELNYIHITNYIHAIKRLLPHPPVVVGRKLHVGGGQVHGCSPHYAGDHCRQIICRFFSTCIAVSWDFFKWPLERGGRCTQVVTKKSFTVLHQHWSAFVYIYICFLLSLLMCRYITYEFVFLLNDWIYQMHFSLKFLL